MKHLFFVFLAVFSLSPPVNAGNLSLKKSVVKIFTVAKPADYYEPWQMGYQQQFTGSGLIIKGKKILTNAHVVSNQAFIQVLKSGDTRKYTATVEFVGHDTEIAMLKIDDDSFFDDTQPVVFGDLPFQRDKVAAYGFPVGGNELSITEGVVSRIEVQTYTHSQSRLLTIQTDAAINPGNSGGPVFLDGKMIGISFQGYSGSRVENTGYIIPIPIINRFLKDISDGEYQGIVGLGVTWQKMENEALRRYHGMNKKDSGVRITKVIYKSPADGFLQEGDILTHLDGISIANNGTIPFRESERLDLSHLLSRFQKGEKVQLTLLRDKKNISKEITLSSYKSLVPATQYDVRPTYFIYAGFVFTPLSLNYMGKWRSQNIAPRFKEWYSRGLPSKDREEIVFSIQVLPHDVNLGYHKLSQAVVTKVNGKAIRNMKDLVAAFSKPKDGFQVLELDHHAGSRDNRATRVVLDAAMAEKANPEILKKFGIPSDRSEDLK